jgi:ArsR family transcriptional regulator
MKRNAEMDFVVVFKSLSNENRLKAFDIIRRGHGKVVHCRNENRPGDIPEDAVCVCEILEQMDVSAPTLSHHLKELRIAELVDVYNRGQWSYYNVREGVLENLAEYFTGAGLAIKR